MIYHTIWNDFDVLKKHQAFPLSEVRHAKEKESHSKYVDAMTYLDEILATAKSEFTT